MLAFRRANRLLRRFLTETCSRSGMPGILAAGLMLLIVGSIGASAQSTVSAKWQTPTWPPGGMVFSSSPLGACIAQKDMFSPSSEKVDTHDVSASSAWLFQGCDWCSPAEPDCPSIIGDWSAPGGVSLKCVDENGNLDYSYSLVAPGICKKDRQEEQPLCVVDNGAQANPLVGNPVVVATGAKLERAIDFTTADGLFRVARTYRSSAGQFKVAPATYDRIGKGWRFNFSWSFMLYEYFTSIKRFSIADPTGAMFDYDIDSAGVITPRTGTPSGVSVTLVSPLPFNASDVVNSGATFKVVDENDVAVTIETYQRTGSTKYMDGRVTEIAWPSGYTWTFAYTSIDELASITDSYNRQATFTWVSFPYPGETTNTPRVIESIVLPDGTSLHYSFGTPAPGIPVNKQVDRLIKVEHKDGSSTVVDSTIYHYEDADLPWAITGITDHRGVRYATFAYDDQGRVISSQHAGGADAFTISYEKVGSEFHHKVTNALGKVTDYVFDRYYYDGPRRLLRVDGEASANCVASQKTFAYSGARISSTTDDEGRVTAYIRDGEGRPTKITRASGTPEAHVTDITWSTTLNKPTRIETPDLKTDFGYSTAGALTSLTQTDTTSHVSPYPTNGQTRTWTLTYTPNGKIATIDGPLAGTGDTVTFTYDTNGDLSTITDELGHQTDVVTVNTRGQPTRIEGPNGRITDLAYDALGRLTSVTDDPSGVAALTQITYDAIGQITRITRPDGSYLDYTYDNARRLTAVENNSGERIEYTHDLLGDITGRKIKTAGATIVFDQMRTYDELGRLLQTIGASSRIWTYAYNKLGELTSETDPRSQVWTRGYDALGRLIAETDPNSDAVTRAYDNDNNLATYTDPRSLATTFVHNGFGEAIQEASPDIGTIVYERNALGLISKRTDARGVVADYTYDDGGRLTAVTYPASAPENVTLTYDDTTSGNKGIGRLTGTAGPAGTSSYVYDLLGRVVAETRVIGGFSHTVAYQYDDAGNITEIAYPSGRTVTYGRDTDGRVDTVTTKASPSDPSVTLASNVDWQPFGPLQSIAYGNGLSLWKTFTTNYDLDLLLVEDSATSTILKRLYHSYVDGRNLTHIWDNLIPAENRSFWYEAANRLQNADGPWGGLVYYYDGTGNRNFRDLTVGGVTTSEQFSYPAGSNRVAGVSVNGTPSRSIGHDAAGNIITDDTGGVTTAYTYDHAGRLANVTVAGIQKGAYVYNPFGQLVSRIVSNTPPSGTVHTVHDLDGNVIVETDGAGNTVREYIWIEHPDAASAAEPVGAATPLAVVADVNTVTPKLWYVHPDHLDRPVMMTDGAKAIVWNASYLPYGGVQSITGTASNDNRFPGQWYQLESGLAYNWHRHYDPSLARYTQPDPLGLVNGPSRYAYVGNDPQQSIDPEGLVRSMIYGGYGTSAGYDISVPLRSGGLSGVGVGIAIGATGLAIGELIMNNDQTNEEKCRIDCEKLHRDDTDVCNSITKNRGKVAGARCHATATQRYAACLAGKPIPPLDTWNN